MSTLLKGVAGSVGISGLIAALGYLVHFAQEDFLGVPLGDAASGNYVLEGARFLADLCVFTFASFVPLLFMAALAGLTLLVAAGVRRSGLSKRLPSGFWATCFLILVLAELALNDLPMVYVSRLLLKSPEELQVGGELAVQPRLPTVIDRTSRLLRDSVICSRVSQQKIENCGSRGRERHGSLLQGWFIFNLLATMLLLILGLRVLPRWLQSRDRDGGRPAALTPLWGFLGTLLGLALLLDLFGLPFAYARTVKQYVFPTVVITLEIPEIESTPPGEKKGEPAAMPSPPESVADTHEVSGILASQVRDQEGQDAAATEGVQNQADVATEPNEEMDEILRLRRDALFQILSSDGDRFVLYKKSDGKIWSLPKEIVQIVVFRNEEEILEEYLIRKAR